MAVKVPRGVYEGLEAVRLEGHFNMFEYHNVQRRAFELGEHAAVLWMEEHKTDYVRGIFEGIEPEG